MQTYKGHQAAITCVKHSPDGRWIVSGDANGLVKVWDLTAGKLVHELKTLRKEPITCADFHPNEFLLACGSGERKIDFWDMESFDLVCSTQKETTKIRSIIFSKDGGALLSATQDSLKVWGWEPPTCYDQVRTVLVVFVW